MQTREIDTIEAPFKRAAYFDRIRRNTNNQSFYTDAQKVRAERMKIMLGELYHGTVYVPSYGTTGISVKVNGSVRNKKELKVFEADWEKEGIIKKVSTQGVIYRIPKVK